MHLAPFPQRVLWHCVFLLQMGKVSPARHTVYWNSTNPRFHGGNYTVRVHINDYMDIVCPHYSLPQAPAQPQAQAPAQPQAERFQLYMVDQEGYNTCSLNSKAFKRWQCDRPFAPFTPVRFLEKIQLFTPFSLGFEFRPGTDYYYISIPIQDLKDRCQRLQVSVCCEPTVRPTTKSQRSHTEEGVQQDASKARVRDRGSNIQLQAATYLLCLLSSSVPWWIQALPGA